MRLLLPLLVCVLLLPACVATHVNEGLSALMGENIKTAFQVIGYPSRKLELDDRTVYTWSNLTGGVNFSNHTAQAYSMVGTTAVTTTVNYTTAVPTAYTCELSLATNKAGTIIDYSWSGQMGALETYSSRLHDYAESKKESLAAQGQVTITKVLPGGQGAALKLQVGDVFVRYNGIATTNLAQFLQLVTDTQGNAIPVEVKRGDRVLKLTAKAGKFGVMLETR